MTTRTRSRRAVAAPVAVLLALLAGCAGQSPSAGPNAGRPLRLKFITTCVDGAFFRPVVQGMRDAGELLGVDCVFTGTPGVDVPGQVELVRQAIAEGYDGIAVNIIDPVAFDEVIGEARERGIPVVAFNVDDHATPNPRLAAVCQQLYTAGRTVAQHAAAHLPGGSHVLMTLHDEGISALDDRLRGEQEVLREKGISWEVIVTGNDPAEGVKAVAAALHRNLEIRAVLCTGQADTEAAGRAVEQLPAGRDCWVAGFDLSPEILRLVRGGSIRFTVDQQPYVQGFYPVIQLTLFLRYGIQPSSLDAGAAIIDRRNVESVVDLSRRGFR